MGLLVEWVRYGRDAGEALRRRVSSLKAGEPLAPVTVVVPSNHVGVAARRLLASGVLGPVCGNGVGVAGITFLTPYRLAELLGAPALAGSGRRPVSTPVIAAALRNVLADAPGVFGPVASHPATEAALVAAYRELRDVAPAGLDGLAATGRRAHDVVRLHRAAHALLEPDWYDEQDLMAAATAAFADPGKATALGGVVVYLPQQLSRDAGAMLAAVAAHTDIVVLVGATGDVTADAEVLAGVRRIAPDAPAPITADAYADLVAADRTRIVLASDADDETRAAVRSVVDAVRAGTSLDRIAILYASPEPYARLVHEHLGAAGIAANGPAVVPLAARTAGRHVLLDLMALPERGFRRQDVFTWLTAAPVHFHGRWAPTAAWERLSREAGVVAGRHDWDERLAHHATELDARAAEAATPDEPEWRAERYRTEAERTRALREFVLGLVDDLARAAASPRPWSAHAGWARRHLLDLLGPATRRASWPPAEAKAADRVDAAFDRLAVLDGVEGPVGLDVFARMLALELENDLGRVGRFGEGVLVGPVTMGVGLDLDLVVVLGLAEGTFPAPVRDDSLLPDGERRAAAGDLPLRAARIPRQHRDLLAALAAARQQVLGVPRGDLRQSSERMPSRWVLDVASTLAGERCWGDDLLRATDPWVVPVASFTAGIRDLAFPATEQEHRLRVLMVTAPARADDLAAAAGDATLARAADIVAARRSDTFTPFDGNLAGLDVPSPVATATSATRLERWAACPFGYFLHDVLAVDEVENPEEALEITAFDRGSLVHEVLERFVVEVLARPEPEQPAPGSRWTAADRARLAEIGGAQVCAEYEARGVTGRPVFWHRDRTRILRDLDRFLTEDDERRTASGIRPVAAELAFGLRDSPVDAVPVALPDGRVLRFRGKADRIDKAADGTLHIVDYKTGSATSYTKLGEHDPDRRGTKLQLAVYGEAARRHDGDPSVPVHAEYWFVSAKGKWKRIGYPVTDAVLGRIRTVLGTIVDGIEAGVFCSHPGEGAGTSPFVECPACDPDGLGVGELRRAWERKRHDPALADYVALAEPPEPGDGDEQEEVAADA